MSDSDPETYAIIGSAMEVHAILGHGFLENAYHEALCHELELRSVPFQREVQFPITYKGVRLASTYRADLVCFGSIIVELKALQRLSGVEESQLLNYLKASGFQLGLLLNFGSQKLLYQRMVWNYEE